MSKLNLVRFLSVILVLAGCQQSSTNGVLTFETIERMEYSGTGKLFEEREPNLIVISRAVDVSQIGGLFTPRARNELANLEYEQFFALVVFLGKKQSNQYSVQIREIHRAGSKVSVHLELTEPKPGGAVGLEITSPYHLVKIKKGGLGNQSLTFNLLNQNISLAKTTYSIP